MYIFTYTVHGTESGPPMIDTASRGSEEMNGHTPTVCNLCFLPGARSKITEGCKLLEFLEGRPRPKDVIPVTSSCHQTPQHNKAIPSRLQPYGPPEPECLDGIAQG